MVDDYNEGLSPGKYCSKCAISLASKGLKLKEIIALDSALRKAEIAEFLISLSTTKKGLTNTSNSLISRRDTIENDYAKQIEKTGFIMIMMQQLIVQERSKAVEFLHKARDQTIEEMKKYEDQSKSMLDEIDGIHNDIDKNMDNIVNNIDIEPFKDVISKYKKKLGTLDSYVDQVNSQYVTINKLPPFKNTSIETIKPLIIAMYNVLESKTALIKCNQNSDFYMSDSSIKKNIEDLHQNSDKNSLYISFDNKEMFANDIISSKQEMNINNKDIVNLNNANNEMTFSNINDEIAYKNGSVNADKSKTLNSTINKFEFDNFINPKTTSSSPEYNNIIGDQFVNNTKDNGMNIATSTTHPLCIKYGILQQNFITHNIEKQFDAGNQEENLKELEDNRGTKKYINILDKINANQTLKSAYYSNIIQNSPIISPLYINYTNTNEGIVAEEEEEVEDYNKSLKDLKAANSKQKCKYDKKKRREGLNETEDDAKISFYNIHPAKCYEKKDDDETSVKDDNVLTIKRDHSNIFIGDNDDSYALNKYSSSLCTPNITDIKITNKQVQQDLKKNFGNFSMFIENKINNDAKKNHVNIAFQKTLFSSPNFKTV